MSGGIRLSVKRSTAVKRATLGVDQTGNEPFNRNCSVTSQAGDCVNNKKQEEEKDSSSSLQKRSGLAMGASVSYDRTTSQGQVVMDPALVDDMIRRLSEARLASLQGKQVHLSFSYTNPCFPKLSYAICCKATNYFSSENKIGVGVCGVVYRGKLIDGREVAVARSETAPSRKNKVEENEAAIDSVLAVLSRPHHKNLVTFVGLCEEDERYLVYEYTKHGALYDRLQGSSSSELNSWKMRIKIAVDAARGIEYLHNYAVPPIIHGHIRSSYILLDENWTARVSTQHFGLPDFGLSWECGVKSDVYGLGVVLLELLTGKLGIFRDGGNGGQSESVVDFAGPAIMAGELVKVLDERVRVPEVNELEAVELVAYTAMQCVEFEGNKRPTMTSVVANLERALSLCDKDSHMSREAR